MHKVAPQVAASVNIPLLHIADATAQAILQGGYSRVALLGTKFTMQRDGFYLEKLTDEYNLDVIVPDETSQDEVHRIIFDELCKGVILDNSRSRGSGPRMHRTSEYNQNIISSDNKHNGSSLSCCCK